MRGHFYLTEQPLPPNRRHPPLRQHQPGRHRQNRRQPSRQIRQPCRHRHSSQCQHRHPRRYRYSHPQQPAPTQQAVPTSQPTYAMDDLSRAAMTLMDTGTAGTSSGSFWRSFGVQSLPDLPQERYGAFATAFTRNGGRRSDGRCKNARMRSSVHPAPHRWVYCTPSARLEETVPGCRVRCGGRRGLSAHAAGRGQSTAVFLPAGSQQAEDGPGQSTSLKKDGHWADEMQGVYGRIPGLCEVCCHGVCPRTPCRCGEDSLL